MVGSGRTFLLHSHCNFDFSLIKEGAIKKQNSDLTLDNLKVRHWVLWAKHCTHGLMVTRGSLITDLF